MKYNIPIFLTILRDFNSILRLGVLFAYPFPRLLLPLLFSLSQASPTGLMAILLEN